MSDKPPPWLFLSLLLGVPFAGGWLFYTASVAEDGRTPITDWMDPFLAGATLTLHLVAITALLGLWPQLRSSRVARRGA
ncbi:MAG TPA: hypothetical protein VE712_03835, partial [Actinomycetota bacterium]|nr:hypothetical protein [Actinomycetota bacterium]